MEAVFKKLARPAIIRISAGVTFLLAFYFQIAFTRHLPAGAPGFAALQLSFSPARFAEILTIWGPENALRYQSSMWADFIFPASYAVFLSSMLVWLSRTRAKHTWLEKLLWFAPFVAGLMDYVENVLHLILLSNGAPYGAGLVLLSSGAALVKWLLLGMVIPVGLLWNGWRSFFRRSSAGS
jgi:hypothetical protein